ncbi:MAG: hypothetical protein ACRDP7_04195 [Trebonia sp.]
MALIVGIGVAGCQGAAPSGAARSSSPRAAVQSSVAAPTPLEWSAARAPLPADTNGVSGQYVSLEDPADAAADQMWSQYQATSVGGLACESVGYCVATASYITKATVITPLIETLSGGTWTAVKAPLPADLGTTSEEANSAYLDLDTCPSAGSCLIVGSYPAADGTVEGLIETAVARHG